MTRFMFNSIFLLENISFLS